MTVHRLRAAGAALVLGASVAASPVAAADVRRSAVLPVTTLGSSAPALVPAAATAGYCPTSAGTTVVVDFTDLGGDVVVRCATGSPDTGLQALTETGFSPVGTAQYGLAFICRLSGRPSPKETLDLPGDADYQENCQRTPPTDAHWHYFVARNGGDWQGSDLGAGSQTPLAGGFEGWSFQLNRSVNVPPRVDPERPGSTGGGSGGSGGGSGGSGGDTGGGSGGGGDSGGTSGSGSGGPTDDSPRSGNQGGQGGGDNGGANAGGPGSDAPADVAPTEPPEADTAPSSSGAAVGTGGGASGTRSDSAKGSAGRQPDSTSPNDDDQSGPQGGGSKSDRKDRGARAGGERGEKGADRERPKSRSADAQRTADVAADRDGDEEVVVTGELPPEQTAGNGSPVATMTGVGLLALLGAGAGVTAWRRRRT